MTCRTAALLNNPTVVEAKQRALLEAVVLSWKRQGIGGNHISEA